MTHWKIPTFAFIAIVLFGMLLGTASPIFADHVPGATYAGKHSGNGDVVLTISRDGTQATFKITNPDAASDCPPYTELRGLTVRNHAITALGIKGGSATTNFAVTARFQNGGTAEGNFSSESAPGSQCRSMNVTWTAKTDGTMPNTPSPTTGQHDFRMAQDGAALNKDVNFAVWSGSRTDPVAIIGQIEAQAPQFVVSALWSQAEGNGWQSFAPGAPDEINTLKNVSPGPLIVVLNPRPGFYGPLPYAGFHYSYAIGVAEEINKARTENAVPGITTVDVRIQKSPERYELFLLAHPNLGADTPVPGRKYPIHYLDGTPADRAARQGYVGRVGEVFASARSTGEAFDRSPADLVKAWLESPDHRGVILDPAYTDMGVACYQKLVPNVNFSLPKGNPNRYPPEFTTYIDCFADLGNP